MHNNHFISVDFDNFLNQHMMSQFLICVYALLSILLFICLIYLSI